MNFPWLRYTHVFTLRGAETEGLKRLVLYLVIAVMFVIVWLATMPDLLLSHRPMLAVQRLLETGAASGTHIHNQRLLAQLQMQKMQEVVGEQKNGVAKEPT